MVALRCPHCGYYANFRMRWQGEPEPFSDDPAGACYTCDFCGMPIAATLRPLGGILEYWPARVWGKDFPDVPERIATTANEAHLCRAAGSARGAAALARAVVESVAKNRGILKGDLKSKIEALYQAGHISEAMREAAHEIRFEGNEAAHGDLVAEPISLENADEIVSLMDTILERVFQEPARVARIRKQREERKRKQEEEEKELASGFSDEPPF